uniref:Odorant receptor n=1 Tax=Ostrinia furnacalis TaxID=93504 RepID=A0A0E4B5J3_OSTFU|nr:putative olfactory receptor 39 [Ostrinia furnacalis]
MDELRLKVMVWSGIYKLHTKNRFLGICHDVYRVLMILYMSIYTVQHFVFIYMNVTRGDAINWQVAVFSIGMLNMVVKGITIYMHPESIDEIHDLIKDPMFAATCKEDEDIIKKNEYHIGLFIKITYVTLTVCLFFWVASIIVTRLVDDTAMPPSYFPFATNPWPQYIIATFVETVGSVLWFGYGHFSIDCSVACYYGRATAQLRIIRYHLEHFFDNGGAQGRFQYKDVVDRSLDEKFVYYVQCYQYVNRMIDNVSDAFNWGIAFHLCIVTTGMGMCVFIISTRDIFSLDMLFTVTIFVLLLLQNFMYCYCGDLVKSESDQVCTSMYFSDWTAVSPRFRRKMLIAMTRWARPIEPRVTIVPISLTTFASILRFSYTLYTMMKTRTM